MRVRPETRRKRSVDGEREGQGKMSRRGFLKLGLASISAAVLLVAAGCAGDEDEGGDDDDGGRRRRRRRR